MEQELEQIWQEWQAQRKEMLALIRRVDKAFKQHGKTSDVTAVFLRTIEQLINSEQASVAHRENGWPSNADGRFIGWYDNEGVYLLPGNAYELVAQALGDDSDFCRATEIDLRRQLHSIGAISRNDKKRLTKKVRSGNKVYNLLHIKPGFISLAGR